MSEKKETPIDSFIRCLDTYVSINKISVTSATNVKINPHIFDKAKIFYANNILGNNLLVVYGLARDTKKEESKFDKTIGKIIVTKEAPLKNCSYVLFNNSCKLNVSNVPTIIEIEQITDDGCLKILFEDDVHISWVESKASCNIKKINAKWSGLCTLMHIVKDFCNKINYDGRVSLDDDSILNKIPSLIPRLTLDKDSIYTSYGFKTNFTPEEKTNLDSLTKQLQKLYREKLKNSLNPDGTFGTNTISVWKLMYNEMLMEKMTGTDKRILTYIKHLYENMYIEKISDMKFPDKCDTMEQDPTFKITKPCKINMDEDTSITTGILLEDVPPSASSSSSTLPIVPPSASSSSSTLPIVPAEVPIPPTSGGSYYKKYIKYKSKYLKLLRNLNKY
jgi:hypothetical protein